MIFIFDQVDDVNIIDFHLFQQLDNNTPRPAGKKLLCSLCKKVFLSRQELNHHHNGHHVTTIPLMLIFMISMIV